MQPETRKRGGAEARKKGNSRLRFCDQRVFQQTVKPYRDLRLGGIAEAMP
jgi:hypothetical protein